MHISKHLSISLDGKKRIAFAGIFFVGAPFLQDL